MTEGKNALALWKDRLEFLQKQEALAADPVARFEIEKEIERATRKIAGLETAPDSRMPTGDNEFGTSESVDRLAQDLRRAGLVHLEFRDAATTKLPPRQIYDSARKEILMVGLSLSTSLSDQYANPTLEALRRASRRGVALHFLLMNPESPVGSEFAKGIDAIEPAIARIKEEVSLQRFREPTALRVLDDWPSFTGIMVDGVASGPVGGNLAGSVPDWNSLLLRVLPLIPPQNQHAFHYGPVYEYRSRDPTDTMCMYIRGFRYYWGQGHDRL